MLHPDVCGGTYEGVVAVHSLSKRSNLAGYRAAFIAGDAAVLGELLQIRKHGGMMTPGAGAGGDGRGARRRRARGASSGSGTRPGARRCGRPWRRTASGSSTARRASTCGRPATSRAGTPWRTWRSWASWWRPGDFYGTAGERFVRVAFTATDERVEAAVKRLG